jgi:hypothetical protein
MGDLEFISYLAFPKHALIASPKLNPPPIHGRLLAALYAKAHPPSNESGNIERMVITQHFELSQRPSVAYGPREPRGKT